MTFKKIFCVVANLKILTDYKNKSGKNVTNHTIFETIYDQLYSDYDQESLLDVPDERKLDMQLVELKFEPLALELGISEQMLLGRLHAYEKVEARKVFHFASVDQPPPEGWQYESEGLNSVNFPRLSMVVAEMNSDNNSKKRSFWFSMAALLISVISIFSQFFLG